MTSLLNSSLKPRKSKKKADSDKKNECADKKVDQKEEIESAA